MSAGSETFLLLGMQLGARPTLGHTLDSWICKEAKQPKEEQARQHLQTNSHVMLFDHACNSWPHMLANRILMSQHNTDLCPAVDLNHASLTADVTATGFMGEDKTINTSIEQSSSKSAAGRKLQEQAE